MPEVLQLLFRCWATKSIELNLSGMNLESLPCEIGYLTSVIHLRLANNKLRQLPPQIGMTFPTLTQISPHSHAYIGNLSNLKTLDIRDNSLTDIPWQISRLPFLEKVEGASSLGISEEIHALKNQLRQEKDKESGPFRKVKLMLVGRENVGKTSLRQVLYSLLSFSPLSLLPPLCLSRSLLPNSVCLQKTSKPSSK